MKLTYKHTVIAGFTGYVTQAIVNNLAPLLFLIFRDEFGISLSAITFTVTLNFCIQLLVDLLSARFADRIGYRRLIVAAHIFSAAGLIGLSVLPDLFPSPYAGLLTAVVLYAIGGGLIEVLISPIVEACPTDSKSASMGFLHSFYCWGTVAVIVFSTLFLWLAGKENWRFLGFAWSAVPIANAVLFGKVPLARLTEEGQGMSIKDLCGTGLFWILIVLMVASGASEQAMSQWASAFAEDGLGVSKTLGDLLGPCMFSVFMGLSRALYAKYSDKLPILPAVSGTAVLCILSYCIAVFSPVPVLSLAGCTLCGFSVGILWPGVFSLASVSMPKGGTAMFALLALAGDVGCSAGPTLVGLVSDAASGNLKAGLLCAPVFPVTLIICSALLRRRKKKAAPQ